MIPGGVINAQTDKPAKQEIELHQLHQLALRADPVECLQKHGPQQAFGGNGWPADLRRIKRIKISAQIGQRSVDDLTDLPQRVIGPHPLLQIHVRKQRPRPHIRTAHRLVSCS